MFDWVCGSLGGSLIPGLHPTTLLHRLGLQMTSFTQDGSSHTEMYSLHFSKVEGRGDASSICFLKSMVQTDTFKMPLITSAAACKWSSQRSGVLVGLYYLIIIIV